MLAIDALVADARDLLGQALDQRIIDLGRLDLLHARRRAVLDPYFAGAVYENLGDTVARQPAPERGQVGVEIGAGCGSRAVAR